MNWSKHTASLRFMSKAGEALAKTGSLLKQRLHCLCDSQGLLNCFCEACNA